MRVWERTLTERPGQNYYVAEVVYHRLIPKDPSIDFCGSGTVTTGRGAHNLFDRKYKV